MLKLVNLDELEFEPSLPDKNRGALEDIDFHVQSENFELDSEGLIGLIQDLYGFEVTELKGDPMFLPSADLIYAIKEAVADELISSGTVGDVINDKIGEILRVTGENVDLIYDGEIGLSRWTISWN